MATALSSTSFRYLSREALYNLATDLGKNVMSSKGRYMITDARGQNVYADLNGFPFAAWTDDNTTATGQTRPDTQVKDENGDPATDEDGNIIQDIVNDNSTNIDMSGMTITLPDGKLLLADQIIYDESTKTYYIDSHDTYNSTTNYYYSWTYYINYTSITYIGQSEEYSKYYEVYYELPDGRDSADLTAEEVEQLNLSIDVIPYGRSADDTSLRSLYHFDGDTKDSSYWNYCTDFTWNTGASLTYMESGAFEGALYLDETEHDFTMTLPSNITSGDFTLQFRYYQSYTAAPQTDSYIQFGTVPVLWFNGAAISYGSKSTSTTQLSVLPIGSWNEIALIRKNGTLSYYLNGICVGSVSDNTAYVNTVTFHFGADQQTYKQLDELRFVNRALADVPANYECTSVPYDTNLALVLPDSVVPVADEYWSIQHTDGYLQYVDFSSGVMPDNLSFYPSTSNGSSNSSSIYPNWNTYDVSNVSCYGSFATLTSGGMYTIVAASVNTAGNSGNWYLSESPHTVSVLLSDGSVYSHVFYRVDNSSSTFDWGTISLKEVETSSTRRRYELWIKPTSSIEIVGIELVEGDTASLSGEWITSVTPMDPDALGTPTLAVRTDLDITTYQIGGVRPSIPIKGQVWALVESGYITSIQIYNGSAWEACDGRIWTGERWIPASSYNIITLQDMYDIADATPNYEYIYTESGFWAWWQKAWIAFTEKLFSVLGSGGSSGCQHTYAITSEREAACTDPGERIYTCSLCGDQYTETIPALGHDWLVTEATETTYSYPEDTCCPDCGETDFTVELDEDSGVYTFTCNACGSSWTVQAEVTYGQTTYTCSRCGETHVESKETEKGLFESIGDFIANGIGWVTDKLSQLVESLSSINDIFSGFTESIKEKAGDFPAFLGAAITVLPEDLTLVFWFAVIASVVLAVWKRWFR